MFKMSVTCKGNFYFWMCQSESSLPFCPDAFSAKSSVSDSLKHLMHDLFKRRAFLKGVSGVQSNYEKQFTNDDLQVVCEDSTETSSKELFARQERFAPSDQTFNINGVVLIPEKFLFGMKSAVIGVLNDSKSEERAHDGSTPSSFRQPCKGSLMSPAVESSHLVSETPCRSPALPFIHYDALSLPPPVRSSDP